MSWPDVAKFAVICVALAASTIAPVFGAAVLAMLGPETLERFRPWWSRKPSPARVSVAFGSTPAACEIAPPEGYREPARGPCVGGAGVECRPGTWSRAEGWKLVSYWGRS